MSGLIKEFEILTLGDGSFTQTQSLVVPMRLVAAHLSIGGLANTVDLTLVATRPGVDAELTQTAGTNDSTLLTITNASASADYDADGRVEQQFKLTVAQGGAAVRGSLICYFSYDLTGKVTSALGTADAAAIGSLTETAPASDTASSGLNGRLQRIAQNISTFVTNLGAIADAAVTAGATGSISAKLRSISRDLIANIVLAAGENLIGKVAGTALVVIPTWTVDTAAYSAGDCVGTKITLASAVRVSGGASILYQIEIMDRANQKPTGNILIFNASPDAATTTDNLAFVYSTDDFKEVARVPVATADYVTINGKASASLKNIGALCKATTGTNLYAVFVTDGAPDFVLTTDFQITFKFIPVD